MAEPTFLDRLMMILRTIASIIVWVVAIIVKIVRGILPGAKPVTATKVPIEDTRTN